MKKNLLLIILLLSLPAFINLFKPVYWNMHDDMQPIRQLEFEKCLKDGQIPCRWTPDLGYGYGYPLFNFYPPLPYMVGQVYRTLGFTYLTTVKLTAISQIILSTIAFYYLASLIFTPLATIITTLLYTYAPYHAVNIYIRGAMNEAWASVFFPLCFIFSYYLIKSQKTKYLIFLSLSYAGLFLSHNPMALTFFPILLIWIIYWLYEKKLLKSWTIYIKFFYSGILSLALTAFFTLPVIFETKFVQIESMFQNYYHYSVHFASFNQLFFSSFWGDGPSVWGTADQMSFMIGYLHWIIPVISFIIFIYLFFKKKIKIKKYILFLILFFLSFAIAFMSHEKSTILWKIFSPIQKIQFPWRFLNHSVFLFSLSSGFLLSLIKSKRIKYSTFILITALIIILNSQYFKFIISGPINDDQKFSGKAWTNLITSGIYDYLPKTASKAAVSPANFPIDSISPPESKYELTGLHHGTDWFSFNIQLDNSAKITLAQIAFPYFEIKDNGKKTSYQIENDLGRMVLPLSKGDHYVYVKLRNTPIRHFSNYLSLFAWIGILSFFLYSSWKNLISKK